ncbi:helix-turn-helix domain-containing protein [Streptomyces sp. NPDC017979]|uniref:helix-turn-helix domain-containing protein n=1 Tax=Streptomyces sp. NPDC017979 TaxID=3365024 RepID=UPI0037B8A527
MPSTGKPSQRSDIGRRVTARREALGMTRQEVAERSGAAPAYIAYVEERASAVPGTGMMLRLAEALQTTVPELTGSAAERVPGRGSGLRDAELRVLDEGECRELLATGGVGRIAVTTSEGPAVVPVNYAVSGDRIVFRTAPGTVPAAAADTEVAFEVDRIDDAFSSGWSVLVVGDAQGVTDPELVRALEEHADDLSWAGGDRSLWLEIVPRRVSGRRIVNAATPQTK